MKYDCFIQVNSFTIIIIKISNITFNNTRMMVGNKVNAVKDSTFCLAHELNYTDNA